MALRWLRAVPVIGGSRYWARSQTESQEGVMPTIASRLQCRADCPASIDQLAITPGNTPACKPLTLILSLGLGLFFLADRLTCMNRKSRESKLQKNFPIPIVRAHKPRRLQSPKATVLLASGRARAQKQFDMMAMLIGHAENTENAHTYTHTRPDK